MYRIIKSWFSNISLNSLTYGKNNSFNLAHEFVFELKIDICNDILHVSDSFSLFIQQRRFKTQHCRLMASAN